MLCGIRNLDRIKVIARAVQKSEHGFSCPSCGGELTLRKGNIKVHHFAHKPPYNCSRGEGETEAHRKCKESIYQHLSTRTNVQNLDLEADFGEVVADVYAVINGAPVAIEVQRSKLSVNEITRRTSIYNKLGINVLWLAIHNDKLTNDRYSPSAWEKWCHAVYFGRVYYWIDGLNVAPIHFSEHKLWVEESNWFEAGGYERSEGGYYRTSKRYKTPNLGHTVDIATHFVPSRKQPWRGGSVQIPECRIYSDTQKAWWKSR